MNKKPKNRPYIVALKLSTGMILKREVYADDVACALGLVVDQLSEDLDYTHVTVTPVLGKANEPRTSVEGEKAAYDAVRRLLDKGFSPDLCGTGLLEAYGAAIAEGRQ